VTVRTACAPSDVGKPLRRRSRRVLRRRRTGIAAEPKPVRSRFRTARSSPWSSASSQPSREAEAVGRDGKATQVVLAWTARPVGTCAPTPPSTGMPGTRAVSDCLPKVCGKPHRFEVNHCPVGSVGALLPCPGAAICWGAVVAYSSAIGRPCGSPRALREQQPIPQHTPPSRVRWEQRSARAGIRAAVGQGSPRGPAAPQGRRDGVLTRAWHRKGGPGADGVTTGTNRRLHARGAVVRETPGCRGRMVAVGAAIARSRSALYARAPRRSRKRHVAGAGLRYGPAYGCRIHTQPR
jgi:hypothetical protein